MEVRTLASNQTAVEPPAARRGIKVRPPHAATVARTRTGIGNRPAVEVEAVPPSGPKPARPPHPATVPRRQSAGGVPRPAEDGYVTVTDAHGAVFTIPDHYVKQKSAGKHEVYGDPGEPGTQWAIARVKSVKSHFTRAAGAQPAGASKWKFFQKALESKKK